MRGRRLARGLVLVTGALAGLLALSDTWASASAPVTTDTAVVPPVVNSTVTAETEGAHTTARFTAPTGPPDGGGGAVTGTPAGDASGTKTKPVTGTGPAVSPTLPSTRQNPQKVREETAPIAPAVLPQAKGKPKALDTVIQGSNTSNNASAESGDVELENEAELNVGPTGGQQIGDNTAKLDQHLKGESGKAIAGSQVFGSYDDFTDDLFAGLHKSRARFFDADDSFFDDDHFFDDPFFDDGHFFRKHFRKHFFVRADLLRLAILIDLVESCLDGLGSHPSLALLRICEHRLERLADEDLFLGHGDFRDVFFSKGGTHALFGSDGFVFHSNGHHSFAFGNDADDDDDETFGFGGLGFPFGSHSGGNGALLFAPFGLVLPSFIGDGFFHHRHVGLVSRHGLHRTLLRLRIQVALLRAWLEALEHHRHLVLGTIHSHSLFDDDPWFDGKHFGKPFGHKTVFFANDDGFFPNHSFWFDHHFRHHLFHFVDDDVLDAIEDAIADLEEAIEAIEDAFEDIDWRFGDCFHFFFFFGGCSDDHHDDDDVVLDLPGIRLGEDGWFF